MYLDNLIAHGVSVVVYILNGFQMKGVIIENKSDHIVLAMGDYDCMIYKHAISTIKPC